MRRNGVGIRRDQSPQKEWNWKRTSWRARGGRYRKGMELEAVERPKDRVSLSKEWSWNNL
jgi:hypothetical protein